MKASHIPRINVRYWSAITLASIFGTNLGDLYAHESGLGLMGGVPILIAIFAVVYIVERYDKSVNQVYYWLAIIILRTGATNVADYLAGRLRLDRLGLSVALALLMLLLARINLSRKRHTVIPDEDWDSRSVPPETNALYWCTMLTAGIFGTVLGDYCSHLMGGGTASLVLGAVLLVAFYIGRRGVLATAFDYWIAVGIARTAGTAIGDWFAESDVVNLGLTLSTIMSGTVFVLILVFWRTRSGTEATS